MYIKARLNKTDHSGGSLLPGRRHQRVSRPGARADVVRDAVVPGHNHVNCITICKYNAISYYRKEITVLT